MTSLNLLHIALIYLAVIRSSLLALLAMNVVTFFMYGIDKVASKRGQSRTRSSYAECEQARAKSKWKAKKSKWRISEATLR